MALVRLLRVQIRLWRSVVDGDGTDKGDDDGHDNGVDGEAAFHKCNHDQEHTDEDDRDDYVGYGTDCDDGVDDGDDCYDRVHGAVDGNVVADAYQHARDEDDDTGDYNQHDMSLMMVPKVKAIS